MYLEQRLTEIYLKRWMNTGQTLKTQFLMSDARQTYQVSLGWGRRMLVGNCSVKRQVALAQMWGCVLYFERRERNKINQSRKFLVRAMVFSVRICMHCLTFSTRVIFYVPFKREIYCPLSSGSRTLTIINILEKKFKTPAIWLLCCWWKQREVRTLNSSSLSA